MVALVILVSVARPGKRALLAEPREPRQSSFQTTQSLPSVLISLDEATQLQIAADRHIESKEFKDATEQTEQALAARRRLLGDMHPDVAYSVGRLGNIAYQRGQYERAEAFFSEALRIREATLGPDHLEVAESLSDLASIFLVRADYVRPEPLFQRALAIYQKASTKESTVPAGNIPALVAGVLNNLALLHHRRGDYVRAESQYLQALNILEKTLQPADVLVTQTMANLGAVYYASGQYDKAINILQRALAVLEKRLQPNDASLATGSFNLAAVYFDKGDYPRAEALFRRALAVDEQALGGTHPRVATRLFGLAEALRLKGEYPQAEPLYERALAIRQQALGSSHPEVAATLVARSLLQYATGDFDGAVDLLSRGALLREETLELVLTTGSEEAKRLYLRTLVDETDIAVTLHLGSAPRSAAAARLALTNIVQRKGRSIDAMADHTAALRGRLKDIDRDMLTQLGEARSRLATMVLRGVATDQQRQMLTDARSEIQRLEQTISARSGDFPVASRKVALADIQNALPVRTALIEFVSYRPFHVRNARLTAFSAPHYAAYVLRRDSLAASVDLQETAAVDRTVARFRTALSEPSNQDVRPAARALYEALMAPLGEALRDVDRVIISADGALNLIPFSALMADDNKYLVEHFSVSYVTSGRDLLRLPEFNPSFSGAAAPPIVVANPLFGMRRAESARPPEGPAAPRAVRGLITVDPAIEALTMGAAGHRLQFGALPGTSQEAAAIAKVLPDAVIYTGPNATEALVKHLRAPSVLHIATHGFFLRPTLASGSSSSSRAPVRVPATAANAGEREDALALSGLAMAGANQGWSGEGEDGILTALEVAGLDLWGTRMVVLSACETGVGDARNGEGVYGLRRALVLAGAESQVMSLWQVSDRATRDLMIAFYQRLKSGEGRADALRNVQLAFLGGDYRHAHPFFWASFIFSGDWRRLPD